MFFASTDIASSGLFNHDRIMLELPTAMNMPAWCDSCVLIVIQRSFKSLNNVVVSSQFFVSHELNTASSFLGYEGVDQSQFRFRLLVGFVHGGDLRSAILALHTTASSYFELRL